MTYDDDVLETTGDYRVVLYTDLDPFKPEDEGSGPVLRLDRFTGFPGAAGEHVDIGKWPSRDKILDRIAYEASELVTTYKRDKALLILERWLRAFYGVTKFETWDSDDYTYIAYDPSCWRAEIGAPEGSISLDDWKAWVTGEVYGYTVERLTEFKRADDALEFGRWCRAHPAVPLYRQEISYEEYLRDYQRNLETWEPTGDSCGGFYGYDYAKEEALEALAFAAGT